MMTDDSTAILNLRLDFLVYFFHRDLWVALKIV